MITIRPITVTQMITPSDYFVSQDVESVATSMWQEEATLRALLFQRRPAICAS